jgi:hypothetical protein
LSLVILLGVTSGCALGPIYARRVEGKVVEKATGKPVAGAEVFAGYEVSWGNHSEVIDWHWTTTAADGSFAIPGHVKLILGPPVSRTERYPFFLAVHPKYGTFSQGFGGSAAEDFPGWRSIVFEIEPSLSRELFEEPHNWAGLCSGLSKEACDRMCAVAFGTLEECYRGGRRRPK